jgi:hypothetical protein
MESPFPLRRDVIPFSHEEGSAHQENLGCVPSPFQPNLPISVEILGLPDFLQRPGDGIPVFEHNLEIDGGKTDPDPVADRRPAVQVIALKVGVHN